MSTSNPKDNSTFLEKVRLRRAVVAAAPPGFIVLETHGGLGRIYDRTWFKAGGGLVMELAEEKAEALAQQRAGWRVYQGDSLRALRAGLAADMRFDVIDLDPYGSPHDYLDALAAPGRQWPDRLQLVVNDGLRQTLAIGGGWRGWRCAAMSAMVLKYGNGLFPIYLEVCRELVEQFAQRIGFRLDAWHGYYTGTAGFMSHYWAKLSRESAPGAAGNGPRARSAPAGRVSGGSGRRAP